MKKQNQKKKDQLGIDHGTASSRLRKMVLFSLLKQYKLNYCFQCSSEIETETELTIEHKIPWLDSEDPKKLFFDLDNVAFSHHSCNVAAARKPNLGADTSKHGTIAKYSKKCRCEECTMAMRFWKRGRRLAKITPP